MGIRELARHLNISIGTVSRALNGRSDVSAETRKRVLEAAQTMNYAPNQSGRSLRKGTTHAIAFVLQPHPGDHQHGEPFFVPFMKGLQAGFSERGLELIAVVDQPGGDQDRPGGSSSALGGRHHPRRTRRVDPRSVSERGRLPFATLGQHPAATLSPDRPRFVDAAMRSVDRLAGLNQRIAGQPVGGAQPRVFLPPGLPEGLRWSGLTFDRDLVVTCEVSEPGGYAATRRSCGVAPLTAILFNNDAIALGGSRGLRDLGLVPGRTFRHRHGVDPFCRYLSPALTGFSIRPEPRGRRLAT